jgi:homoserine dehydrogenase
MEDDVVKVGVLGCGNVGAALVRLIGDHADVIEARAGVRLEVERIAVRNLARERDVPVPANKFTHDAEEVVGDPTIDVIVEVIGGIEPARGLIIEALKSGKPVVTANKELLANVGKELFESTSCSKPPCAAASRSSDRCANRWPVTAFGVCSASSTAQRTSSSPG